MSENLRGIWVLPMSMVNSRCWGDPEARSWRDKYSSNHASRELAVSINPSKSHSAGANFCIFSAVSSMRKSVNFFSEAFSAPKCHPLSISARSWMSWLYFRFIKLLAHAHTLSDDLGCFRKVAKRFDEFPRRSFVHGWSLYLRAVLSCYIYIGKAL